MLDVLVCVLVDVFELVVSCGVFCVRDFCFAGVLCLNLITCYDLVCF